MGFDYPVGSTLKAPFPLSWVTNKHLQLFKVPLPFGGYWFPYGAVPDNWSVEQLAAFLEQYSPKPVVVRGWTTEAMPIVRRRGWCCWQVGVEGRKPLTHASGYPKKTRHAIRKGYQNAEYFQWPDATQLPSAFFQLLQGTTIAHRPQLQWLFRNPPDPAIRLYVAASHSTWFAAIGISTNHKGWVQAEWMARHGNAPYGVLDALVHFALQKERQAGNSIFSFGEVPFVQVKNLQWTAQLIIRTSAFGLQGVYNYSGLFFFKNKYVTQWHPIFLCGYPNLTAQQIAGIAWKSRALQLWQQGLNYQLKNATQHFITNSFIPYVTALLPFLPH